MIVIAINSRNRHALIDSRNDHVHIFYLSTDAESGWCLPLVVTLCSTENEQNQLHHKHWLTTRRRRMRWPNLKVLYLSTDNALTSDQDHMQSIHEGKKIFFQYVLQDKWHVVGSMDGASILSEKIRSKMCNPTAHTRLTCVWYFLCDIAQHLPTAAAWAPASFCFPTATFGIVSKMTTSRSWPIQQWGHSSNREEVELHSIKANRHSFAVICRTSNMEQTKKQTYQPTSQESFTKMKESLVANVYSQIHLQS